jgi:predicted nucleic acid-binding protein
MVTAAAFGGGVFIADKSAWQRADHSGVAEEWHRAMVAGQIAICPIVKLELLYSTRDSDGFDELETLLAALWDVPLTRSVTDAGIEAMRALAHRRRLYHRVKLPDILIAAAAQDVAIGVLHYDHDYDRLAEVLNFESRWLAPPGSLD